MWATPTACSYVPSKSDSMPRNVELSCPSLTGRCLFQDVTVPTAWVSHVSFWEGALDWVVRILLLGDQSASPHTSKPAWRIWGTHFHPVILSFLRCQMGLTVPNLPGGGGGVKLKGKGYSIFKFYNLKGNTVRNYKALSRSSTTINLQSMTLGSQEMVSKWWWLCQLPVCRKAISSTLDLESGARVQCLWGCAQPLCWKQSLDSPHTGEAVNECSPMHPIIPPARLILFWFSSRCKENFSPVFWTLTKHRRAFDYYCLMCACPVSEAH